VVIRGLADAAGAYSGMKGVVRGIVGLLLVGAVVTGLPAFQDVTRLAAYWRNADADQRREALYQSLGPLLEKVERAVPPQDSILLYSTVDPALLPYVLFPRRIWQVGVEPETNRMFMDLPAPPFQERSPVSFPVDWVLRLSPQNLSRGGELIRIRPAQSVPR